MVFVREIKKGGKIYRYRYKSKRVDGKVKSIYIGREELKHNSVKVSKKNHKPQGVHHINKNEIPHVNKDDKWIIDKIIEFNKLMEESMDLVIKNKIETAANRYNRLLGVFNQLSNHVGEEEKLRLYDKTKQIYDRIQEINL